MNQNLILLDKAYFPFARSTKNFEELKNSSYFEDTPGNFYCNPIIMSSNKRYLPDEGLEAVVDMALDLGLPLLVTGEPGTGKTQLAYYIAKEKLKLLNPPLIFNTKTDSQARDLFYQYDAVRHFRDSGRSNGSMNPMDYITFQALGKAILESKSNRQVVLIDEIDKAPRDFPNDILYEFENLAFRVKEATTSEVKQKLGFKHFIDDQGFIKQTNPANKPVLILTSNSEKNLPDPFMRRVLYHHIEFPERKKLEEIVRANIEIDKALEAKMLTDALDHFRDIRENKRLRKIPATAELLSWIHVLHKERINLEAGLKASGDQDLKKQILKSYAIIAKNKEDFSRLKSDLGL